MLGYTQENNDIFVFFESGELLRLGEGKIQGNYINIIPLDFSFAQS